MTKLAPEWVRTCNPVIRSPARYRWTTAPARSALQSVLTLLRITHLTHRKSYLAIICPNSHEKLTKSKLGQVGVGSNIAQNHSSSPQEGISGHYLPQFIWKVDQNWNQVKLESVWTLLKITHPASRKSYLVMFCPNSHEKFTKIEIKKLESAGTLLRITHLASRKSIWSLLSNIFWENWLKVKNEPNLTFLLFIN